MRPALTWIFCLSLSAVIAGCAAESESAPADNRGQLSGQLSPARSGADWPCLYGPDRNSTSRETDIDTHWPAAGPRVAWRRLVGSGYSSPVIAAGKLLLFHRIEDEEVLECVVAETGQPLWQAKATTDYLCPVEYSNGPYSTPSIAEGRVFAWGAEGRLRCVALKDGREIWNRDLATEYRAKPAGFYPFAASPLVEDDRLILPLGGAEHDSGILALDAASGRTLWHSTSDRAGYASPVAATIHGRRYVSVFTADGLVSLDPSDGRVHWSIPFAAKNPDVVNATTPIVAGDYVFVSGYSLGNLCLKIRADASYEELWRDKRRNLDSQFNNLILRDGCIYGFATDHSFRCLDLQTGEVLWKLKSSLSRGSSLAVGNRLILLGERGHLGAIDLAASEPAMITETRESVTGGEVCFSSLALSRGLLYVRTEKELICFDLRKG